MRVGALVHAVKIVAAPAEPVSDGDAEVARARPREAALCRLAIVSIAVVSIAIVSIAIVSIASAVVVGLELGGLGGEVSTCVGTRVSWWVLRG